MPHTNVRRVVVESIVSFCRRLPDERARVENSAREQLRNVTIFTTSRICERTGCDEPLMTRSTGRPARYRSAACRVAAHRQGDRGPVVAEAHDHLPSDGLLRQLERSWHHEQGVCSVCMDSHPYNSPHLSYLCKSQSRTDASALDISFNCRRSDSRPPDMDPNGFL